MPRGAEQSTRIAKEWIQEHASEVGSKLPDVDLDNIARRARPSDDARRMREVGVRSLAVIFLRLRANRLAAPVPLCDSSVKNEGKMSRKSRAQPEHWIHRSEAARTAAKSAPDDRTRFVLVGFTLAYESLARRARKNYLSRPIGRGVFKT